MVLHTSAAKVNNFTSGIFLCC